MANIKELSVTELDSALAELEQRKRTSLRQGSPPEDILALEGAVIRLTNELRRRGL